MGLTKPTITGCSYMTVDCMDNSVVYGKELHGLPTSWELIDCHSSRRQV